MVFLKEMGFQLCSYAMDEIERINSLSGKNGSRTFVLYVWFLLMYIY